MIKKDKGLMILSQYFYPDFASTGQLLTELAEDLISYDYHIKVLTAKPSYHKNKEKYLKEEIYRGIDIYRVAATKFNKNMMIGRLCNFLSYLISVLFCCYHTFIKWAILRRLIIFIKNENLIKSNLLEVNGHWSLI